MDIEFDNLKQILDESKKVNIYPFSWRNGVINLTENGYVGTQDKSSNYSFYQKYFTGKDVLTITWDGSTKITAYDQSKGQFKYNFTIGTIMKAVELPPGEHSLEIGKNDAHEEFINMTTNDTVNFAVYNFFATDDDLYKPYVILSETGRSVLFLTNFSITKNPGNKSECITVLTFTSSKDKLMTSGRAIEQFIQFAAPGEPYAFPEEKPDGTVVVSETIGQNPTQVKYIQIEHQGAAAYCGTLITGRKVWKDEDGNWISSAPMFLLPSALVNAQTNPLNKTGAPSTTYYLFTDETIETRTSKDFQDRIKDMDSSLAPIKNEGVYTCGASGEWDSSKIHQSNRPGSGQDFATINDLNWRPVKADVTRDSTGCLYTTNTNVLETTDSVLQVLIKNSFLYSTQLELPLDFTDGKPYRWSTLPILGNLVQRFYGDKAMFSRTQFQKTISLAYFLNTTVARQNISAFTQPGSGESGRWFGTLGSFLGEGSLKGLSTEGVSTCFAFELTDIVSFVDSKDSTVTRNLSTVNFAQVQDEDGNYFYDDHTSLYFNTGAGANIQPQHTDDCFVIDQIENFALFGGKIKISCFGKYNHSAMTNPCFTQTVLSSSKFESENLRNWATEINSGSWSGEYVEGTIEWPIPPSKNIGNPLIKLNRKGVNVSFGLDGWTTTDPGLLYKPTDGSGPLNNLTVLYSGTAKETCLLSRNDVIYEQELSYDDFITESVADKRAWLLQNIDHILVDVSGSVLSNNVHDYFYDNNYNASIKQGYLSLPMSEFGFNTVTANYDFFKTLSVGAFNNTYYNPLKMTNWDQSYCFSLNELEVVQGGIMLEGPYNSSMSQDVNITITLKPSTIYIKFMDNTTFYSYGKQLSRIVPNVSYYGFGPKKFSFFNQKTSHIWSQIQLNTMQFIKK